jgi:hypothetical protein
MSYACLMVYVEADATPEQRVSLADQFNGMLIGLSALAIPPPMTTDGVIMDMMRTKLAHRASGFAASRTPITERSTGVQC